MVQSVNFKAEMGAPHTQSHSFSVPIFLCSKENSIFACAQEIDLYNLDKVRGLTALMRALCSFPL